jgi:D-lactate dehydrogenase (cytochrome)
MVREHHGKDESAHPMAPPDAVVFPETNEEVSAIVKLCGQHGVPIIAFGVGSSIEGHVLAIHGGLSMDMNRMNRVLEVNVDDLDTTVQAGVTRKQLNRRMARALLPIDRVPTPFRGMAALRLGTNATPQHADENVVGSRSPATADHPHRRSARNLQPDTISAVLVGSEGTLGIITDITLRLYPQPEAVSAAICMFPSVDAAVRTVIQTIQLGVPIARCELLDALTIQAVNRNSKLALREAPMLLCEFHGTRASVEEQAQTVQEIAKELGGMDFEWATKQEYRTRLWQSAPRGLPRVPPAAPEQSRVLHRRVRAHLAACRVHRRNQ